MGNARATVEVVAGLIRKQFPQWADLAIRPVDLDGWDNTTFRLDDEMSVRLPSDESYVLQIDKEHRWLPVLARHLPLPIPTPIAKGASGSGFAMPWSIYRWLDGEPAALVPVRDLEQLSRDLAAFLEALHLAPAEGGPVLGAHNYHRGGPLAVYDDEARAAIGQLHGRIDTTSALDVWDAALHSTWQAKTSGFTAI